MSTKYPVKDIRYAEDLAEYRAQMVEEVLSERGYQQEKWGDGFDKLNTPNGWLTYIVKYLGLSVTMPFNLLAFRTALVKVATLCFAAIEWCDRTNGNMPKRHYDK